MAPRDPDVGTLETLASEGPERVSSDALAATCASGDGAPGPADPLAPLPVAEPSRFAIGAELGRGGLGRILRAQDPVFGRPIALKELLHDAPTSRARFLREATITARLQHPSIVPVYTAGRWPDGAPFYAMKLVEGRTLADALRARRTLRARIELLPALIAVCEAVSYAHSRRVIHRDLKPHNVLLGDFGEAVVIDWGLAKDIDEAEPERDGASSLAASAAPAVETVAGAILGTPAYMPHEQAAGEPVDQRADVYALGAMLDELLSGDVPYAGARSAEELLGRLLAGPPRPLELRAPDAPADLIAVAKKAMARDAADRYPDAGALAADLRRFQTGQLVSVRRYSARELAARWLRRHRAAVTVGALAAAALVVVGLVSVRRIVLEGRRADAAARRAEAARADAERERAAAAAQRDRLVLARAASLAATEPVEAVAWLRTLTADAFVPWSAVRTIAAEAAHHGLGDVIVSPDVAPQHVRVDRDGTRVIVWAPTERLSLIDVTTRRVTTFDLSGCATLCRPSDWSADGRWLLIDRHDRVELVDAVTGAIRVLDDSSKLSTPSLSTDGAWIAAGVVDGSRTTRVWATGGGPPRTVAGERPQFVDGALVTRTETELLFHDLDRGEVTAIPGRGGALSRDGTRLIGREGQVWAVRGVATGSWRALPGSEHATDVKLAPDRDAAFAFSGGALLVWDLEAGTSWSAPGDRAVAAPGVLVHAADGAVVATWWSGETRRWSVAATILDVAASGDGRWAFVATGDGLLRRLRLEPGPARRPCPPASSDAVGWISPGARWTVWPGVTAGTIEVCDGDSGERRTIEGGGDAGDGSGSHAFGPRGDRLVTLGAAGELVAWDLAGATGRGVPSRERVRPLWTDDDGARILGWMERGLGELGASGGDPAVRCAGAAGYVIDAHGTVAAVHRVRLDEPSRLEVCDLATGARREHAGPPAQLLEAIAPGGARAVTVGLSSGTLWDLHTGEQWPLPVGATRLRAAFSADGATLVIASLLHAVVFDRDGAELHRFRLAASSPKGRLELSPDGSRLLVTTPEHGAAVYDLATGSHRVLTAAAAAARWSASGDAVLTLLGREARRWPDDLPHDPEALRRWLRSATDAVISPDGTLTGPPSVTAAP